MEKITLTHEWQLISKKNPSYTQIRSNKYILVYVSDSKPDNKTDIYFTCNGAFVYPGGSNVYMKLPDTINDEQNMPIESIDVVVSKGK